MEHKVARGLGERSTEEKERLTKRINELKEDHITFKNRNKYLKQQSNVLHQELRKSGRKLDEWNKSKTELQRTINEVELEIKSCEMNSEKVQRDKEEDMVVLDLARLEVRRLRDILNSKATEVYELEDAREMFRAKMNERNNMLCVEAEVRLAQLRAAEDERHHCAIELGQRSIAAEKIQLKYEMITKAHNTGDDSDGNSQVYNLIAAAQKRADLQLEGDKLDVCIRKKEKEIKELQNTLASLTQRNTAFRGSFARVDKHSEHYKSISKLEQDLEASDKLLFEVKKTSQDYQRNFERLTRELDRTSSSLSKLKLDNENLDRKRCSTDAEIRTFVDQELTMLTELQRERYVREEFLLSHQPVFRMFTNDSIHPIHNLRDGTNSHRKHAGFTLQELSFQGEIKEKHARHIIRMLMEIGHEFPSTKNDIISSLTFEGLEVLL